MLPMHSLDISGEENGASKRRSSSRSIKRRRFDDELVESSLRAGNTSLTYNPRYSTYSTDTLLYKYPEDEKYKSNCFMSDNAPPRKRQSLKPFSFLNSLSSSSNFFWRHYSKQDTIKKNRIIPKDAGRWKPTDDLALIEGILQIGEMKLVHYATKFTCNFTFNEINQRWLSLLYDNTANKEAIVAIKNLNPETIAKVSALTKFSDEEERVLAAIPSEEDPEVTEFLNLKNENPNIIRKGRRAESLKSHWELMKKYKMLDDQRYESFQHTISTFSNLCQRNDDILSGQKSKDSLFPQYTIPTFPELLLIDPELLYHKHDSLTERRLACVSRRRKEVVKLEENFEDLKVIGQATLNDGNFSYDMDTLAILKGRFINYQMKNREITIGRNGKQDLIPVDIDLTVEGTATHISRKQAILYIRENKFWIENIGKKIIFINGIPIPRQRTTYLPNNSVLKIGKLFLSFIINKVLMYHVNNNQYDNDEDTGETTGDENEDYSEISDE